MRAMVFSSIFMFLSYGVFAQEDLVKYEIPEAVKDKHEEQFYNQSLNYEQALSNLQIVLIVDKSGSQQVPDKHPLKQDPGKGMCGDSWTQWDNTFYAAKYLAESLFEYDQDGQIPVVFFGYNATDVLAKNIGQMLVSFKKNKPTKETTNLQEALELAFQKYATPKSSEEKILFIVLTDGCPNSGQESSIKSLIKSQVDSRGLNKDEKLNLLFIRIGDDPGAVRFLQELDDSPEIGDYVDTKSDNMMYKMGPKNLVLNAIYEHLDSQYTE